MPLLPSRKVIPLLVLSVLAIPAVSHAALLDRVNEAFESVYGRMPIFGEWEYWATRVQKGEKKTFDSLLGAMGFHKARGNGAGEVLATIAASPPSTTFRTDKNLYPSI